MQGGTGGIGTLCERWGSEGLSEVSMHPERAGPRRAQRGGGVVRHWVALPAVAMGLGWG